MAAHGCGLCSPRSQRTLTAKKGDATAPGGRRGACFRDLASELLVAGQPHAIGVPILRGPDPISGLGLALRIVGQECDGRSIQCTTGRWIVAHGSLQFGGWHCQVARFPDALGIPTGEHAQRNGNASMCPASSPGPPTGWAIPCPRGWMSSPGPRGSATSRGNPLNPVRPPSCFRCRTFPCSYR